MNKIILITIIVAALTLFVPAEYVVNQVDGSALECGFAIINGASCKR